MSEPQMNTNKELICILLEQLKKLIFGLNLSKRIKNAQKGKRDKNNKTGSWVRSIFTEY